MCISVTLCTASTNRDDVILTARGGHVNSKVFAKQPAMLQELEDNIQRTITEMLHRVIENWRKRVSIWKRVADWPTFCSNHKWHKIICITKKKKIHFDQI